MNFIINAKDKSGSGNLWRHPDFMKLWTGQTISEIGSRISREGIPLTAVLVLGATPVQMGALTAIGAVAVLLFSLLAGIWVDRLRRRPILIAADLARAALLATIPLAAARNVLTMPQLYSVLALTGVLTVFFDVSYQSYLPSLIERGQLLEGNSKLAMSTSAAEIAGPGLTGFLVQLISAPIAILFDAISFLFSALMVALIRRPEPAPAARVREHWRKEIGAGLRFIAHQPILRALAARSATAYLFYGLIGPLYILYGIRELGLRPGALGIAIATGGLGSLIGSTLAPRIRRRLGLGKTFIVSSIVIGLTAFFIPLAHGSMRLAMTYLLVSQLFGDAAFSIYYVNALSLRQALAPADVLGRVNGAMQLLSLGVWPLAAIIGGILAEAIGLRATLTIAASGVLLSSAWLILSPVRKLD